MKDFIIFRDVYTENEKTGLITKKKGRKWLRVTKSGRYVWQDRQEEASRFSCDDSCTIMDNCNRQIRTKYNYGKIWKR